jgi:hypothetical protein
MLIKMIIKTVPYTYSLNKEKQMYEGLTREENQENTIEKQI